MDGDEEFGIGWRGSFRAEWVGPEPPRVVADAWGAGQLGGKLSGGAVLDVLGKIILRF